MPWAGCWRWHGGWPAFPFVVLFFLILGTAGLLFGRRDRLSGARCGPGEPNEPPLEAAKRRYARGEITADEFEEIKKNLG